MGELAERRYVLLAPLELLPRPPIRAVVGALVRPLAELSADASGSGRTYVRFLAALDAAGDPYRARMGEAFAPQYKRLLPVLARALPDLPPATREFRLALIGSPIVTTLAAPERGTRHWIRVGEDIAFGEVVETLVDAVAGLLAAPITARGGTP
jgi:hypothetical protein